MIDHDVKQAEAKKDKKNRECFSKSAGEWQIKIGMEGENALWFAIE